jgi:fatty acid synthase
MYANRISYALDLTGPSFLLDTACSSSAYALNSAYSAMKRGECDAALVCGANLMLSPHIMAMSRKIDAINANGFCRPFDHEADGYVKSESAGVLFLQRKRDAKRIYASILHTKTNCDGRNEEGSTVPSAKMHAKLMTELFEELNMDPCLVNYVEAHSTGTIVDFLFLLNSCS